LGSPRPGTGPIRPLAIYFHGAPGAPLECARLQTSADEAGVRLVALDRNLSDPSLSGEAYFRHLGEEVTALADGAPVHLIGFSLGAFVAIRTAEYAGAPIAGLHLISAAGPIDGSDVLERMAGRSVFRAARDNPGALRRMTKMQGWLAQFAPGLLQRLLFAGAAGADRALAADQAFRAEIRAILRLTFEAGADGYLRDLLAYVQPWREHLTRVAAPASVWHGGADTWAPPEMATALHEGIPTATRLTVVDGLSHYSCLVHAMPLILREIGGAPELTP
jgi:pimeloyl-ACP methyl ester carboxylesterase